MISVDITAPVGGATPDRTGIVSGGAAIENLSWSPTVNERFEYDTAYTVSFNLKANPGITFSSSPLVTVNGMPAQSELIDPNTARHTTFSKTMPDPRNSVAYVKTSIIRWQGICHSTGLMAMNIYATAQPPTMTRARHISLP